MEQTPDIPTAPSPRPRRLLRSNEDRMLVGVASGLGRYFEVDPVLFRIGFAVTSFFGGAGLLAYFAFFLFVPEDDGSEDPQPIMRMSWRTAGLAVLAIGGLAGIAALAAGAAWAAAEGFGEIVLAVAILLGLAMVGLSFRGPARWLVVPALALAAPVGAVAATGFELDGGYGERVHSPASVAEIPPGGYKLAMGSERIDLTQMRWRRAQVVSLRVRVGIGELKVVVPPGVCVEARTHTGAGDLDVRGHRAEGADLDIDETPAASAAPRLRLDAEVELGELQVTDRWDGLDEDSLDRQGRARRACRGAA